MLVVVVDESAKHARIRSRRLLSKYLPQIASSTWMGSLSTEGIEQLREELSGKASKNSALCCFRVRSNVRFERLWIVGSKDNWSENGWFSYRESAIQRDLIDNVG